MVRTGFRPVAGRPPLLGFGNTNLDLGMFWYYHDSKPNGSFSYGQGAPSPVSKARAERAVIKTAEATMTIERLATVDQTSPETKSNIEDDLCSACHMAHIAVTLAERALGNGAAVDAEEANVLLWALYETRSKIRDARDGYLGSD
jgi:hypothetical protein